MIEKRLHLSVRKFIFLLFGMFTGFIECLFVFCLSFERFNLRSIVVLLFSALTVSTMNQEKNSSKPSFYFLFTEEK